MRAAIIGAGVSGLTCGVLLGEGGHETAIFAEQTGNATTSGAAAALWFPYDAEPMNRVIPWAMQTYQALVRLVGDSRTGVSMIELRQFSRTTEIPIPEWALSLGARRIPPEQLGEFVSGFALNVPLMDTTVYLDYLDGRFRAAGGIVQGKVTLAKLEEVEPSFDLVVNCTGVGSRNLIGDADLEPHRGQVVIVPRPAHLSSAIVSDDEPLMYAIPRRNDCVFGGTNELRDSLEVDPRSTESILRQCSRVLKIDPPEILHERVGLRPFRKSGVRLERETLSDGRPVIHNYGHGGSGFTLSWGCANEVADLAAII